MTPAKLVRVEHILYYIDLIRVMCDYDFWYSNGLILDRGSMDDAMQIRFVKFEKKVANGSDNIHCKY